MKEALDSDVGSFLSFGDVIWGYHIFVVILQSVGIAGALLMRE